MTLTTSWDTTATALLVGGLNVKKTYGTICHELRSNGYAITRSACIAKARRMGLSNGRPVGQHPPKPKPVAETRPVKPKIPAYKMPPPVEPMPPSGARSGLLIDLDADQCRFIVSPRDSYPPYLFCTDDRAPKSPYCARHHAVVYIPPSKKWG